MSTTVQIPEMLLDFQNHIRAGQDAAVRARAEFRVFDLPPEFLQGDNSKAQRVLGWKPKVTFEELVKEMVDMDLELMKKNPNA
ncbi:GDP-mannose 4,6 dehydratase [Takifugu flavidus]|uniref:GDP-mannose 4,6 dehydratase n=1 Tax=Takifugu flavidus TaxID=433684 RepID=A0A5C6MST6_9TELE|nr:GDP-mannose 4,6 dehydratase [Takifugu flavidus]